MAKDSENFPPVSTCDDLAGVSGDVQHLAVSSKTRAFERLHEFSRLTHLWLGAANENTFKQVAGLSTLEHLVVGGMVKSLPLQFNLPNLRRLNLIRMTSLESLAPLRALTQLRALTVTNGKKLTDYSPIGALARLEELEIGGDQHYERLTIDSFEWIGALKNLRRLSCAFTKVTHGSIRPVGELFNLKELQISNTFPRADIAWLAGRLPGVTSRLFPGFVEFPADKCPQCRASARVMMSGSGSGLLCRNCDAIKFTRMQQEYEAMVQTAIKSGGTN